MLSDRFNRFLLLTIFIVSVCLLSDNYFFPLKPVKAVLLSKTALADARLRVVLLSAKREKKLLSVPLQAYHTININDTILLGRSYLTNTILQLQISREGAIYRWQLGFLSLGGMDFLLLFIIGIPVIWCLYATQIKEPKKRRDITLYTLSVFVVLLVLYFLFG